MDGAKVFLLKNEFEFFTYHQIEGGQHQKIKTDELGINESI